MKNSTARNPQASDSRREAQSITLSVPNDKTTAPGERFADAGTIETLEEYSRCECLTGRYIQEVNV